MWSRLGFCCLWGEGIALIWDIFRNKLQILIGEVAAQLPCEGRRVWHLGTQRDKGAPEK